MRKQNLESDKLLIHLRKQDNNNNNNNKKIHNWMLLNKINNQNLYKNKYSKLKKYK